MVEIESPGSVFDFCIRLIPTLPETGVQDVTNGWLRSMTGAAIGLVIWSSGGKVKVALNAGMSGPPEALMVISSPAGGQHLVIPGSKRPRQ